jgi:class 3 adenylate cyclase
MRTRRDQAGAEERLVYRLILAIDVERYSRLDAQRQLKTQTDLRGVLDECAVRMGLDLDRWHRQVNGDGELAVLPEDIHISKFVGIFAREFERALAALNDRRPGRRLRVRLAMHHGTMIYGPLGPAGDAPVVVCRLLDSTPFREFLNLQRHRDLALIVSDSLYRDVVCTGFCPLNRMDFEEISVVIKGVGYRGHIYRGPTERTTVPEPGASGPTHKAPVNGTAVKPSRWLGSAMLAKLSTAYMPEK